MADSNPQAPKDRWQHLVSAAFHLDAASGRPEQAARAAAQLVDSALEVFTGDIDPVEDFEGYAVRRLLLALRKALPPPGGTTSGAD